MPSNNILLLVNIVVNNFYQSTLITRNAGGHIGFFVGNPHGDCHDARSATIAHQTHNRALACLRMQSRRAANYHGGKR